MRSSISKPESVGSGKRSRRGIIFIVASPSGAGKTSICKQLLQDDEKLRFSVSFTSREPRAGEIDGVDYHFISAEEFRERIERDEFLEWAEVHAHLYGTGRAVTEEMLSSGIDVLMDIDVQGAEAVKREVPDAVRIFILPPSREVWLHRLRSRGSESEEELERRIAVAEVELQNWREYDYAVVNNELERAILDVKAIIAAERLALRHNPTGVHEILRSFGLSL